MKESEALEHVRLMMLACQKTRSNTLEAWLGGNPDATESDLSEMEQRMLASLQPWLFGDGNVLPTLARVVEQGTIDASGFYNLMHVANRPEMRFPMGTWALFYADGHEWPEPSLDIIRDWEPGI